MLKFQGKEQKRNWVQWVNLQKKLMYLSNLQKNIQIAKKHYLLGSIPSERPLKLRLLN